MNVFSKPKKTPTTVKSSARGSSEARPFLVLNLAITADGKINASNRRVLSFSSRRDGENMLELRATVDAVMSGARTVDLHPVTMGTGPVRYRRLRSRRGLAERHLRVVLSGTGSVDPKAEIFKHRSSPIIVLTGRQASERRLKALLEVADEVKAFGELEVNFHQALRWLRRKWNVKRLLCEGGGELDDALFRAGVVDEVHLTICPKIFGGRNAPTIADGLGFGTLGKAARFRVKSWRKVGEEVFAVFTRE